jgi:hypothetical protein
MSSTPHPVRRYPWLRVLVLLLALLVPGAHTETPMAPVAAGETIEYDVLDTPLRPPGHAAHRAAAPTRPAPSPAPAPVVPRGRSLPTAPRTPYSLLTLRTVVLRC